MRLKLFRARDMAEAMARVRSELGSEALILGSRRVAEGIEVTAALEPASEEAREPAADFARRAALTYHAVPDDLARALDGGPLEDALKRAFAFGCLNLEPSAPPLLLVGPPGAGKTLTCVRLATRLVMAGIRPLTIAADGKRAGAIEQLSAYTRLLGLRLIVADHPMTLARALAARADGAPVLIDAFGADPFDPIQADDLRALAAAAGAVVALVLPAGLDSAEAGDLAAAYRTIGAALLIGTRLDLARRLGGLLAAAAAARLPLTEAGIGPGAADGLTPLTPALLAARLMQTGKQDHDRRTC